MSTRPPLRFTPQVPDGIAIMPPMTFAAHSFAASSALTPGLPASFCSAPASQRCRRQIPFRSRAACRSPCRPPAAPPGFGRSNGFFTADPRSTRGPIKHGAAQIGGPRNGTRRSHRFRFYFFLTMLAERPIGNWSNQLDLRCNLSSRQRGCGPSVHRRRQMALSGSESRGYLSSLLDYRGGVRGCETRRRASSPTGAGQCRKLVQNSVVEKIQSLGIVSREDYAG